MSILREYKFKTGKVWVPADAKSYASHMQVYTDKTDEAKEKKQGLRVVKGSVACLEVEVVFPLTISLQVAN